MSIFLVVRVESRLFGIGDSGDIFFILILLCGIVRIVFGLRGLVCSCIVLLLFDMGIFE